MSEVQTGQADKHPVRWRPASGCVAGRQFRRARACRAERRAWDFTGEGARVCSSGACPVHGVRSVEMTKLVRVPHNVDRGNFSILYSERRCLDLAIGLQRDETGQPIDQAGTQEP